VRQRRGPARTRPWRAARAPASGARRGSSTLQHWEGKLPSARHQPPQLLRLPRQRRRAQRSSWRRKRPSMGTVVREGLWRMRTPCAAAGAKENGATPSRAAARCDGERSVGCVGRPAMTRASCMAADGMTLPAHTRRSAYIEELGGVELVLPLCLALRRRLLAPQPCHPSPARFPTCACSASRPLAPWRKDGPTRRSNLSPSPGRIREIGVAERGANRSGALCAGERSMDQKHQCPRGPKPLPKQP
jgi:hypothetical protein